ncbi:D-inositol 3-phosphate glycosyltransferase [Chloroflexota bacterium]|nr:D-inositol 3-phosphate glycosyltransferase [Chloroflexota bacterium]
MRIAMLSLHTCPLATLGGKETGGMNVYVHELASELGRQGVGVDVFTRSQDEHEPHVKHDLGNGNRVLHIPAGPEHPLPKAELYQHVPEFVGGVRLAAAMLDARYDVIHSHYWLSGVVARQLQQHWPVPVVHMAHTLGVMKNRVALSADEQEPQLRLDTEQRLLRWANHTVAATVAEEMQLRWLLHNDNATVRVIPPGVDTQRFRPSDRAAARAAIGVAADACLLLFVGRIEPLKGTDTLLQAVQLLRARGELPAHLSLSIIGGDPDQPRESRLAELQRLMELRDELGLGEVVTFLGKRAQETLPDYYVAADVVVMPSLYESFGMVALEAMACGTPVVASQVGGLAYLVRDGETGYLVPDRDPAELADRLSRLLSNPQLRAQMGAQAVQHARTYAWPDITRKVIGLYADAVRMFVASAAV